MKEKVFPKLFALSSAGKQKEWQISVHELEDGTCAIRRTHGYTGKKMQTGDKVISSGKNIGRSNETTIWQQAVSDAQSLWNKKIDAAYTEGKPKKKDPVPLPMLAHSFDKRKHNIEYPCYAQTKLNGCRVFATKISENEIKYTSRKGKVFDTLDHLTPELLDFMQVGDILDGEIYVHGMSFQQIVRLLKKWRPETEELEFHIYDKADPNMQYWQRFEWLENNVKWSGLLRWVITLEIEDEQGVYDSHDEFIRGGYEGAIIRNRNGYYKFRHRSKDLQKYKEFTDEEFTIVGGKAATGAHEGCVVFECEYTMTDGTKDTFDVTPKATLKARKQMLKDLDKYIGKELTVRYQEKSEDNAPIFPVGIIVRDYE